MHVVKPNIVRPPMITTKKIHLVAVKTVLACIAVLMPLSGYGRRISQDNALSIAAKMLNNPEIIVSADPMSRAGGPGKAYYVVRGEGNKGFAIIGADDRLPRIIGYSDTNNFNPDNLPPQLSAMLDSLDLGLSKMDSSVPVHTSWTAKNMNVAEGKWLHTAEWAQDAPFNNACPKINGKPAVAGCGAVALAIVMKYHNWPVNGVGQHSYYSNGEEIGFDFANAGFDFTKMPDDISKATEEEIDAVSQLIYAAGISLGTVYGAESSTHAAGEEALSLSYFFDYAPDCQFIFKAAHPDAEWTALTVKQIDEGFPVIFGGAPIGIPMGHAWVVDGYSLDKTLFYCNFGWGGESNGYYALNDIFGYYYCDGMTFNAKPNKEQLPNPGSWILSDIHNFANPGIKISVPEIKAGEPFELSVEGWNLFPLGDDVYERIALVDKEDNLKEILYETVRHWGKASPSPISGRELNVTNLVCKTPNLLATDRIQFFIKRGEDGEWMPVTSTMDGKSFCSISGHDWPTKKLTFHIEDGVKVILYQESPQGTDIEIADEQEITTLMNDYTININVTRPDPEYRIRFSVNDRQKDFKSLLYSGWYMFTYYSDFSVQSYFSNKNVDNFDIAIDYVKASKPLTLNINKAGILNTLITKEDAGTITDLTLTGKINAMDIWYITESFPILENLDLSKTTIESCQVEEFPPCIEPMHPSAFQKANMLPEFGLMEMWTLKEVQLPESLEYIGGWALSDCYRLRRLELPEKIKEIYNFGDNKYMLWAGNGLRKVISKNSIPPAVGEDTSIFGLEGDEVIINGALFVPAESVEAYKNANGWKSFHNIYPMDACFIQLDKTAVELSDMTPELISGKIIYQGNDAELKWSISDPEICELIVIENNLVTIIGRKNGTATITVAAEIDGKTITAECIVTVTGIGPKRFISMESHTETIEVGKNHQMNAWILEDDVAKPINENILWTTSDEKVATIENTGLLKAIAEGQATIRATAAFDPNLYIESVVTVTKPSGIDDIADDMEMVRVEGNNIIAPAGCIIYDMNGRMVSGEKLKAGIYIVKTPSKAIKVIVR